MPELTQRTGGRVFLTNSIALDADRCRLLCPIQAAFWMSVYLFFLLGVPAVLTALSVSTYYSRKAPETEPAAAGDEQ